jgi:hypothetical protein
MALAQDKHNQFHIESQEGCVMSCGGSYMHLILMASLTICSFGLSKSGLSSQYVEA